VVLVEKFCLYLTIDKQKLNNMTKSEFIKKYDLTEGQFNGTEKIGGSLVSRHNSIPEGFNPNLGGSLWLGSLKSIPEGFNPNVGGSLWLSSLKSIPEGFNPTVGGSLYLESLKSKNQLNPEQ
jgi:hypothetical protein